MVLALGSLTAGLERRGEARRALRLHADHADLGVVELGEGGDAAGEAAAAHGDEDRVDERELLDDLHGDGALARGDDRVVEGVDEGVAVLGRKLQGVLARLVVDVPVQDHLGAVALGALHLDERGGGGHDHDGLGAGARGGEGDALRVVAGACRDDAAAELLGREGRDLVVGAAHLVGARALHVLGFEEDAVAGELAEVGALDELGRLRDLADLLGGLLECVQGEHLGHGMRLLSCAIALS